MHFFRPTHPRDARAVRSKRRTLALATYAVLFVAAVGCGSDGPMAPGFGSGNVTASGAVTVSGSGISLFQLIPGGSGSVFQVVIAQVSQSANAWQVQIADYSGRLEAGTYNLSPQSAGSTDPTANFYYSSGSTTQLFNSTSGQLVITSSSSSEVRGTFNFTATDPDGGAASVSAHGSFIAPCSPGFGCP